MIAYFETDWYSQIYEERYDYERVGLALARICKNNEKLS